MPRTVELVVPSERTGEALDRITAIDGVMSVALTRGASVLPPGDVVTVTATTSAARAVLKDVAEFDLSPSVTTSTPGTVISAEHQDEIAAEGNEALWDEMVLLLRRNANPTLNFLVLMGLSGAIAAAGLWADTVHVVIAAMVVAPGFQPLLRIPLGPVVGSGNFAVRGGVAAASGYLVLTVAAAATLAVLLVLAGERGPLDERTWVTFWSTTDRSDIVVSAAAAAAGAIVVTAQLPVLTAGVMIALALVPAAALTGMALVAADLSLALAALVRWSVDVVVVVAVGGGVFFAKQRLVHRQPALAARGD